MDAQELFRSDFSTDCLSVIVAVPVIDLLVVEPAQLVVAVEG